MKATARIVLVVFAVTAWCTAAFSADQLKLTSQTQKETVTVKDGKKEVKTGPAAKVLPGETLVFSNHYKNAGTKPAEKAVITNPISKHVTYIDGSAFGEGATITFSVDNGKTFETPGKLMKTVKGKKTLARPEDYTQVRWTFTAPIAPGAEGEVGFKGKVK
jgi:uncharacterized repeat protein (TIGR01451 family)